MILLLDLLLALGLLGLALAAVAGAALLRSILMFVVFGVVLAVVWARLGAPDLALAETAIGAGLTGALLLVSYRRLLRSVPKLPPHGRPVRRLALPMGLLSAALVLTLGFSGLAVTPQPDAAGARVLDEMAALPFSNPVTAVLLVFRGYDTLLETAVLLAAYLGARLVLGGGLPLSAYSAPASQPLVGALLSLVVPMSVLVSFHLLHAGSNAPGGAFQGAAVLAAAGVLMMLCGRLCGTAEAPPAQRLLLVLGLLTFCGIGLWGLAAGAALALPGYWALLLIETTLLLSIASALVLLFAASGGVGRGPQ